MQLRQRLRHAGLRVTQARLAVADLIHRERGHWSADELHARLDHDGVTLTRATVYNVLNDLRTAGIVHQPATGPGAVRYEWAIDRHHHFVCRQCGAVDDVPARNVKRRVRVDGIPEGATVEDVAMVFRGLCPTCNRKAV